MTDENLIDALRHPAGHSILLGKLAADRIEQLRAEVEDLRKNSVRIETLKALTEGTEIEHD